MRKHVLRRPIVFFPFVAASVFVVASWFYWQKPFIVAFVLRSISHRTIPAIRRSLQAINKGINSLTFPTRNSGVYAAPVEILWNCPFISENGFPGRCSWNGYQIPHNLIIGLIQWKRLCDEFAVSGCTAGSSMFFLSVYKNCIDYMSLSLKFTACSIGNLDNFWEQNRKYVTETITDSLRRADPSSRGVLQTVSVSLWVWSGTIITTYTYKE